MTACITSLPEELVETVCHHVELQDIGLLRLTSRELFHKASNGIFGRYLNAQRPVLLRERPLQALAQMSAQSRSPEWIKQNLRLAGVASIDDNMLEPDQSGMMVARLSNLLANIFRNIATRDPKAVVKRLRLVMYLQVDDELRLYRRLGASKDHHRNPPYRMFWKDASREQVYQARKIMINTVVLALDRSKLPIEQLQFLPKGSGGYGVNCSMIPATLPKTSPNSLASVKNLEIYLTRDDDEPPPIGSETQARIARAREKAIVQNRVDTVTGLLRQCDAQEKLTMSYTSVSHERFNMRQPKCEVELLPSLAAAVHWNKLVDLDLREIQTSQVSLQKFYDPLVSLRRLSMDGVILISGKFQPIFDTICAESSQLEHLFLDLLAEERQTLQYEGAKLTWHRLSVAERLDELTVLDYAVTLRRAKDQESGMAYMWSDRNVIKGRIKGWRAVEHEERSLS
ncbi:hypothetical protein Slin15195_G112990 [Septoria linicola]|uniref:F-box domain-containing protein n=1 Tax=Septoria linicola TaxID=215465 RepID=A0A9Q9AZJ4_9PEZI|nr:hypothetical protein Slin15195_G112990 [Septoria linicola]